LPDRQHGRLQILIANESSVRLAGLASIVSALGHETIAAENDVAKVGPATARARPDVALVALGESNEHALQLITSIVAEAECPVIAVLPATNIQFVDEAAKRGIFAYVVDSEAGALESALEIVLLRFSECHGLEGAFGRRATVERAKGILMERHGVEERRAFELLRDHARQHNTKLVDISRSVIEGHLLLRPR
jgi:AmiR/NasT family two-component response regulator